VYVPSSQASSASLQPTTAPLRKALYLMSEAELEQWAQHIETALSDMQHRNDS